MNACLQTNIWVYRLSIVLGLIVAGSLVISLTQIITGHPNSQIIVTLGLVAITGLIRLLISPLNQCLFE